MILTDKVLLVEPIGFGFNLQTAGDNKFQSEIYAGSPMNQFNQLKKCLIDAGIKVTLYSPKDTCTPDAVFPNNWFSTFPDKRIMIYPMMAPNRQLEKRAELIEKLKIDYPLVYDLSSLEKSEDFLEGTGSLIIDHELKLAYACISKRTTNTAIKQWESSTDYKVVTFKAADENALPIYHTNVLLTIATHFAIICNDAIIPDENQNIIDILSSTGRKIIAITFDQLNNFCGNCLEVKNIAGEHFLLMSDRARNAFTPEQIKIIEESCKILSVDISAIETIGGGSVRCMVAELF